MLEIINKSGVVVYPIIALSILSLAIFMERLFSLRVSRFAPANFTAKLIELIKLKRYSEAENLCALQNCALSNIVTDVLQNKDKPWNQLVSIAEESGRLEADKLTKFQETLITIIALAPLLGLLGTIFGMITIFNVLSGGGVGDSQALSGGIAEALLTTAEGLSVAIPSQIFYYIIKAKADYITRSLEKQTASIVNLLSANCPPYINEEFILKQEKGFVKLVPDNIADEFTKLAKEIDLKKDLSSDEG